MKMKYILAPLLIALVLLGGGAFAEVTAQTPATNQLRIVSADDRSVVLELTVAEYQTGTVILDGQTYDRLLIPDTVQTDIPGEPQLPARGALVGLPGLVDVSLEILQAEYETLPGLRLPPAPAFDVPVDRLDVWGGGQFAPKIVFRPEVYQANAFYPGQPAVMGDTGIIRDQAVAQVQFYPAQYNPVSGEVRLYRRIVARLAWEGGAAVAATATARGASPAFERLLEQTILNYDTLARPSAENRAPSADQAGLGAVAAASSGSTLKIGVTTDGLYQLTPGQLAGAGFDLAGVSLSTIKIKNKGSEVPIYAYDSNGNNAFDGADYLLFYGTAITDIYTTKNIYWLEAGGANGQRMVPRSGAPSGGAPVPGDFPATLHAEPDTYYWQTMPNGEGQDHYFWDDKLTAPASRDHTLVLNNISAGAATATVRVRLKGRTDMAGNPDHHTRIYLNGTQIDDKWWDGLAVFDHVVTVNHSLLVNGNNIVRVEAVGDTGAAVDQFFVNWIEIDYRDTYVAEGNRLSFGAPAAGTYQFEVTGFTTGDVQIFDVTDPANPAVITNPTVVNQGGGYKVQFEDAAQASSRYLALTAAQRQTPASIELDQPSSWKSTANGADYIIITHENFYNSVQPLASHRSASGLRVATIKVQDVYDEFNYGIFNPQAIRDLLDYAYHNWTAPAPTYVLLVGDAYQDYKDNLNTGSVNYVPTQIIQTDDLGDTPSDNWFVLVEGADVLPDMFIGRLPVQNSTEADDEVDKIIRYEQTPPASSWNTKVLLVADDDDAAFESISDQLADLLPYYYTAKKVYARNYPPGNPTTDIRNAINGGDLLVNYTGHGNVEKWGSWSGGTILTRSDVSGLSNTDQLPFVTTANCLNGFFSGANAGPDAQVSLAEEFLRQRRKGAVAVWAATSLGYPSGHRALMQELYDSIFQDDQYALGAATTAAKYAAFGQNTTWGSLVETFVLFGDPATRLGLPTNYPYVESTTPADGARDVPLNQNIQIVFSKPMNPATVSLSGPGTAGLTLTPSWNADMTVVTYAHSGFSNNQTLTFTINGQDNLGNPLGAGLVPSTWTFTTPMAPASVSVSGPTTGAVNSTYTFTANVSPSTTTQPVTYVWEATGQTTVTHTGGDLDDSVSFNWNTPGAKTITVTASNDIGSASKTYQITLYVPPGSVSISGPSSGAINNAYTFNAAVSPGTTSQPLTYVWQATGLSNVTHTGADLDDSVSFNWSTPGTKTVTVTASNGGGSVTKTYQVNIKAPPTGVAVSGPATGVVQVGYTFNAAVSPSNATPPFTYIWQATEQTTVTHTGGDLDDSVSFNWNTPGAKTITVTASNDVGSVSNTYSISLSYSPPTAASISGPISGAINTPYTFSADVSPITATQPITYVWQATGQSPVTHTGGNRHDEVTFNWDSPGQKVITVTATNAGGSISQSYEFTALKVSVDLTGSAAGVTGQAYTFLATVSPSAAATPVTYSWEASGFAPVTRNANVLTDTFTLTWDTPGAKSITVTINNADGTAADTHAIEISIPPSAVNIDGPTKGAINIPYPFAAAVSPATATQPITYVWEATGQAAVTQSGAGPSEAVTFTWDSVGTKAITVTATNAGGAVTDVHLVTISEALEPDTYSIFVPLVVK